MRDPNEEHHIGSVVRRVQKTLDGAIPQDVIEERVRAWFAEWDDVPVRDFLPIFAERDILGELRREPSSV